jgi:hypothetical protein
VNSKWGGGQKTARSTKKIGRAAYKARALPIK